MLEFIVIALVGLAIGIIAVLAIGVFRIRRMRSRHRERLAVIAPTHTAPAALFGLASDGKNQTRGVGTAAMSDTDLMFVQLVPDREVRIDRSTITSAQLTRQFMGSTASRDLVVVTWEVNGMGDAVALSMDDASGWAERLG